MKCTACDIEMSSKRREFTDEYRGESVSVVVPGLECPSCGLEWFGLDDVAEYGRHLADGYRRNHHLLTSNEIREARESVRMSQEAFARFLGVGVASVKRWEWGAVQDRSHDKLIRVMTNPDEADAAAKRARSLIATGRDAAVGEPLVFVANESWFESSRGTSGLKCLAYGVAADAFVSPSAKVAMREYAARARAVLVEHGTQQKEISVPAEAILTEFGVEEVK